MDWQGHTGRLFTPARWLATCLLGALAGSAPAAAQVGPDQSPCANGISVPHPEDHPQLVADCKVLLALRDQLAGDAALNWGPDRPITRWRGVWVDHSFVRKLVLAGVGLTGTLPPTLAELTDLEILYIFENKLTGPIPAEIGKLEKLKWLAFSHNELSGPIPPELSDLANLQGLYLHGNALTGEIPPELVSRPTNEL